MKRTIYAAAFCTSLLIFGAVTLTRPVEANKDVVEMLLDLPAPPPPNPLMPKYQGDRSPDFYDKSKPPADDAPIEDILDYWAHQSASFRDLGYNITPSARVLQRLRAEISKNPEDITKYLNAFRGSGQGADFVKDVHDRLAARGDGDTDSLRTWLKWNSRHFAEELEGPANASGDADEYVSNHEELLALGRNAWERAEPIVNRHYNDHGAPTSRVMAMWALYRRALDTDSIGDIDKYRGELMAVVEDRTATPGMRDLALDALVKEKDWSGRDEWYFSLLADETLADLRVNGQRYTGLTTIIYYMPDGHYTEKMIEFARSDNRTVRNAAVRNLLLMNSRKADERIIRTLLPWLRDKEWASEGDAGDRASLIRGLQTFKIPESVPALIALLDEREMRESAPMYRGPVNSANAAVGAAEAAARAANRVAAVAANAANSGAWNTNSNPAVTGTMVYYPHRMSAVAALERQADARAVPALRRILALTDSYSRGSVIKALLSSGGYSDEEKIAALEASARMLSVMTEAVRRELGEEWSVLDMNERARMIAMQAAAGMYGERLMDGPVPNEALLGDAVLSDSNPSEELVRALMDRIEVLEKREPALASTMRSMANKWRGPAVNAMLLRDLRNGRSDVGAVVKMLANRKELRETQMNNVLDAAGGQKWASAISACILEDRMLMEQMLAADNEAAAAVMACARLVRAPLEVNRVAALLGSTDATLVKAAERYLESEDSREARAILLARYQDQAKILGATTYFGERALPAEGLDELFISVNPGSTRTGYAFYYYITDAQRLKSEDDRLKEEILKDPELLGLYAYGSNKIRIYSNRVMFAAEEDDKRYRERPLTAEEFRWLREYLTDNDAGELKPFLGLCEGCEARQLVMLGKAGGRRVFLSANRTPAFFQTLDDFFEGLRSQPGRLKYTAEREIAGLEVELADDNLAAEAVWKEGNELRVLLRDRSIREKVENEIAAIYDAPYEEDTHDEDEIPLWQRVAKARQDREWEGYAWWSIRDEGAPVVASAPGGIEYPPARDGLAVERDSYPWMVTARGTELRYSDDGLYAVRNGKLSRIVDGYFTEVFITADGRWAVGSRYVEDEGMGTVRVDLGSGRIFPVDTGERPMSIEGYLPELNRFVLGTGRGEYYNHHDYHGEEQEFPERSDNTGRAFFLLDPVNGAVREAPGEVRPIVQQTFRPLQSSGRQGEYWAALPDNEKNETVVGIYEARFMGFKPVLRVPKMNFDSMDMWVDAPGGRLYFIYKGHVLSVPMQRN